MLTAAELIAFEDEVAARFAAGSIRAPVHLAGGNEENLIEVFRTHVGPADWVLGTWRSHYHCLLKGVPSDEVMAAVMAGRSISLCFPAYRVLCSGIVGGCAPIAVGIAAGIKRKGEHRQRKVVCFLGDMAAASGIVWESFVYAGSHDLPVLWVIEDNGMSVCTSTELAWGVRRGRPPKINVTGYEYKLTRPHVGVGRWVKF